MTYDVFGGTLNLTQSVSLPVNDIVVIRCSATLAGPVLISTWICFLHLRIYRIDYNFMFTFVQNNTLSQHYYPSVI